MAGRGRDDNNYAYDGVVTVDRSSKAVPDGNTFNIFNRAQFGAPISDYSSGPGEFSVITQPVNTTPVGSGTPRQIQLALRLEF